MSDLQSQFPLDQPRETWCASRPAYQNDSLQLAGGERVQRKDISAERDGAQDVRLQKRFQKLAIDCQIDANTLAADTDGKVAQRELDLRCFRQGDANAFCLGGEARECARQRRVGATKFTELSLSTNLFGSPTGKNAVEVLSPQMIVAIVVNDPKPAGAGLHQRDIERSTA